MKQKSKPKKAVALVYKPFIAIYSIAFLILAAPLSQAQTSSAPVVRSVPPAPAQLPNLGDGSDMTSSAERRMGDRIARELYRDPDYIDDPVLADYVQGIWQPLLAAARLRGDLTNELDERFSWEIMMGRDRSVNAFALPGGYFGLHLGLVAIVTSRDELASVLGHELSHVTQRHISRLIAKQSAQTPWLIGAMILGALAASKRPDTANALIIGGQAVAAQNQLNFSRDMEREADRIGFGVMTQAGFEPYGFVSMFEKLQQASRHNDNGAYPYLRSHPLTTERIADMQARLQLNASGTTNQAAKSDRSGAPGTAVPGASREHAMVAARAGVLSNPAVDALRAWAVLAGAADLATQDTPRQAASVYGAVLAAIKLREFPSAVALQTRLTALTRADERASRLTRLLGAELALAMDDAPKAAAVLAANDAILKVSDASPVAPGRPELVLGATAEIRSGLASPAAQRLQTWVAGHPRDAQAWQLLSTAYAAQGQTLRAIRADAEAQAAHLDYAAALERFKAAQVLAHNLSRKGAADHVDASIIDTRARQTALLLKEQSVER